MVQNDFKHPIDNVTNFLAEYAAGKRNFAKAELSGANLSRCRCERRRPKLR